jgi:hypothetical protein
MTVLADVDRFAPIYSTSPSCRRLRQYLFLPFAFSSHYGLTVGAPCLHTVGGLCGRTVWADCVGALLARCCRIVAALLPQSWRTVGALIGRTCVV